MLVQGYELAVGVRVGVPVKVAVALLVGLLTVGLVPVVSRAVDAKESA